MKMELPDIPADERTPLVESLLAIIRVQQDRIQQLEATVQELRDEIAILKGQKPRPGIKPSRLEADQPKQTPPGGSKRPGSAKRPKTDELHIDHEVLLHPEGLPVGATFKGYEPYVVQELRYCPSIALLKVVVGLCNAFAPDRFRQVFLDTSLSLFSQTRQNPRESL